MKVHGDWRYQTPKVTKSILRLTLTIYVTKNLSNQKSVYLSISVF